MLAGLQGSGKTTLAGKLALWLKSQGNTPLLVAADLQRPNAVQQLEILGQRAGVPVFAPFPGSGVGDPVQAANLGIAEAQHKLHNVVIIDTAGRLGIDEEMMQQAADIRDAVDPDEILFVVDAMIGQDAVQTAQAFLDGVGYDGVVLTKLDGDARGGAALSIRQLTGKPVMFASTGEKLEDFDVFHPDRMASRILDLGDVLTLIEQAERTFDQDQAAAMAGKLASGEGFTLEDFVEQLAMVRKLGPIGNLLGMLPGAAQNREALSQVSDKDLDRAAAIVNSMTVEERRNPKIINGSRRARIAQGLRRHGRRGQPADRPVPRGPEDDAADDGQHARHGRHAAAEQDARQGEEEGQGRRPPGRCSNRSRAEPPGGPWSSRPAWVRPGLGAGRCDGGLARRASPAALPGFGALPGLGGDNGFKLPGQPGGFGRRSAQPAAGFPRPAGQEGPLAGSPAVVAAQ